MAYRLKFAKISDRSVEKIDRGYEIEATRDGGEAILRLSGILSEEVRVALVGQAFLEGVRLPADTEKPVDDLLLLFTVSRFEQALRSRSLALDLGAGENSALALNVRHDAFSEIFSGASRKDCSYRISKVRDFYCSATCGDPVVPITPALCLECPLPDSRWACSHLAHLSSGIRHGGDGKCECSPKAMCNLGQPAIRRPEACRAGGNKCWERVVELEAESRSRELPPEALPEALDFLHAIWRLAFGRPHRLLNLRSAMDVATLVGSCNTRNDFVACMSALDDIIKSMEIDDNLMAPEDRSKDDVKKGQTLNRLAACVRNKVADAGQREDALRAISILRSANRIRVALQHSGCAQELVGALAEFDISPTDDWAARWRAVRQHVTEALIDLRKVISALADVT